METTDQTDVITATLVPEGQRLGTLPATSYDWMGTLCRDYSGGYWDLRPPRSTCTPTTSNGRGRWRQC
jgi:hypothetical protein